MLGNPITLAHSFKHITLVSFVLIYSRLKTKSRKLVEQEFMHEVLLYNRLIFGGTFMQKSFANVASCAFYRLVYDYGITISIKEINQFLKNIIILKVYPVLILISLNSISPTIS